MMLPETKTILAEFGWYEGRQVPEATLTGWVDTLAGFGLQPFDAALAVLREFGGLYIRPRIRPKAVFMVEPLDLNPLAGGFGEEERVEGWIEFLKQPAYPIGHTGGVLLIVAEDGQIFWDGQSMGGYGEGLIVGSDIYAAMDALLLREKQLEQTAPFWSEFLQL